MNQKGKFFIEISQRTNYKNLTANILYEEELVAILSQEKEIGSLEIEIFSQIENKSWIFPLDYFVETLRLAKKKLNEQA